MAAPTLSTDAIRTLQDRLDITDVLYRYASTIDRFDHAGLRSVLADDLLAQYGNADPVVGGDAVAAWIGEAIAPVVWQHHLLSVYHVEVDGDRASALVYHTSYQGFEGEPDKAKLLVGRYHNELRREEDGWKISRLVLEILWGEDKVGRGRLPRADRGPGPAGLMRAAEPFALAQLELRNRLVGTAHGRGIIADGLPLPEDAEYWRRRAAGGVAMLTVGGTVVAPGVHVAAQDHDRGVAPRGGGGDGRARGGDPRRGRGRRLPARAPRPRDDRRRAVVPSGGAGGGAVAARADAAAAADRRRGRRGRRGLPRVGGQRRRGGVPGDRAARRARLPARAVPVGGGEPGRGRRGAARDRGPHRPGDPRVGPGRRRGGPAVDGGRGRSDVRSCSRASASSWTT